MRRTIEALTILLVLFGVSARGAELQDLRVSLEIIPSTTLPGIPVTFRITFTNPGAMPAAVPPHGLLVATDATGHSFVVWPKPIHLQDLRNVPIPAGGSALVELHPRGSLDEEWPFVEEPQLNKPGEFRFHLVVGKFWHQEDGGFGVSENGILSPEVTLHVIEPVGIDLDVWHELSKNRPDQWVRVWVPSPAGWTLAARIVRQYPDSQYAGWIAASGVSRKAHENAEALRGWLSRVNHDEYTEARELRLALFDDGAAREWTQIKDNEVLRHTQTARSLLDKLKNSKDPAIASLARARLERLGDLEEYIRERSPRVP
jgi:hypothetical protein